MREKTPVRFRLQAGVPGEFVTGRVVQAHRSSGVALVRDLHSHYRAQYHPARYIDPIPRCHRTTL